MTLARWPLVCAVTAAVLLGFAVLTTDREPVAPSINRNIVSSFWSVPVSGGRPRLVLRTRGWQDGLPAYRRDGSILFQRWTSATTVALFSTTDRGGVRRLRNVPVSLPLAYSAARDEIAVQRDAAIFAESLSGKGTRLVARVGYSPTWSADGSTFAFGRQVRPRPDTYLPELVVLSDGRKHVFRLDAGAASPVALSPHGERLLFIWGRQLFLLDTRTGRRRLFANRGSSVAAWSPDGHTIAYVDREGLVTRDLRTNRRRLLVGKPFGSLGSFSRDGRTLVYLTQKFT